MIQKTEISEALRCVSAVIGGRVVILIATMLRVEHKSQVRRSSDILRRD
jgi:hypothetical protein